MASTKSSRVNPKYKKRYRVGNWPAYERGLRARGDVTVWFAEEALSTWTPPPTRCRGGQQRYSDPAILTALTLRVLFHLPLRQTEGFVASLLRLMGLDLNTPDHTTLSRRNRDVLVPAVSRTDDGPIHLVVDSTGLKIYGAGEWCSRKHRKANERSGWRKLHIGVDDDGYVVAETLTQNTVDDADVLPDLLGQVDAPLRRFTGDGAYDTRSVYKAVGEAGGPGVEIVVPPRRPATASPEATGPWAQRRAHSSPSSPGQHQPRSPPAPRRRTTARSSGPAPFLPDRRPRRSRSRCRRPHTRTGGSGTRRRSSGHPSAASPARRPAPTAGAAARRAW